MKVVKGGTVSGLLRDVPIPPMFRADISQRADRAGTDSGGGLGRIVKTRV